jgi:predicted membrane protein
VGGAFILRDYVDLPKVNFWQLLLAVLFILAGVFMILRRKSSYRCGSEYKTSDLDSIDEVAVFGGGDRTIVTNNFKGGRILAVFGGSNFNLIRSKLAPGKNYLDLMIVFGGMKLVIPEDWNVKIEAVPIFGGFTDKHRVTTPTNQTEDNPVLIIKGLVIFGGGEIISY